MPTIVKDMPISNIAEPLGPLVVVLAYDGLCTFEFGVAYEVFGLPRPEMGDGWYRYAVSGAEPGPLRAAGGLRVTVDAGLELLDQADLIVVPGWRHINAPVPGLLISALQAAHKRGARIISLCSGIAVLAAAGFLNGKRATTHWRYLSMVQSQYPTIRLQPDILYTDEGDVLTAAGSAAGIDLCLHIVRRDFGPDAANSVARRLVVSPHRDGGQTQFVERPVPLAREGARLSPLLDWMRVHLNERHSVARLAARAGMSLRTFQRRFEATAGMTPREWLIVERLRRARELLEQTDEASLEDVAATVEFGSLATLRHHFRQRLGMSPSIYRARFSVNGAKSA